MSDPKTPTYPPHVLTALRKLALGHMRDLSLFEERSLREHDLIKVERISSAGWSALLREDSTAPGSPVTLPDGREGVVLAKGPGDPGWIAGRAIELWTETVGPLNTHLPQLVWWNARTVDSGPPLDAKGLSSKELALTTLAARIAAAAKSSPEPKKPLPPDVLKSLRLVNAGRHRDAPAAHRAILADLDLVTDSGGRCQLTSEGHRVVNEADAAWRRGVQRLYELVTGHPCSFISSQTIWALEEKGYLTDNGDTLTDSGRALLARSIPKDVDPIKFGIHCPTVEAAARAHGDGTVTDAVNQGLRQSATSLPKGTCPERASGRAGTSADHEAKRAAIEGALRFPLRDGQETRLHVRSAWEVIYQPATGAPVTFYLSDMGESSDVLADRAMVTMTSKLTDRERKVGQAPAVDTTMGCVERAARKDWAQVYQRQDTELRDVLGARADEDTLVAARRVAGEVTNARQHFGAKDGEGLVEAIKRSYDRDFADIIAVRAALKPKPGESLGEAARRAAAAASDRKVGERAPLTDIADLLARRAKERTEQGGWTAASHLEEAEALLRAVITDQKVEPRIAWRRSVTDFAADVRGLLDPGQVRQLARELLGPVDVEAASTPRGTTGEFYGVVLDVAEALWPMVAKEAAKTHGMPPHVVSPVKLEGVIQQGWVRIHKAELDPLTKAKVFLPPSGQRLQPKDMSWASLVSEVEEHRKLLEGLKVLWGIVGVQEGETLWTAAKRVVGERDRLRAVNDAEVAAAKNIFVRVREALGLKVGDGVSLVAFAEQVASTVWRLAGILDVPVGGADVAAALVNAVHEVNAIRDRLKPVGGETIAAAAKRVAGAAAEASPEAKSDDRLKTRHRQGDLWRTIDEYVVTCGGDPKATAALPGIEAVNRAIAALLTAKYPHPAYLTLPEAVAAHNRGEMTLFWHTDGVRPFLAWQGDRVVVSGLPDVVVMLASGSAVPPHRCDRMVEQNLRQRARETAAEAPNEFDTTGACAKQKAAYVEQLTSAAEVLAWGFMSWKRPAPPETP